MKQSMSAIEAELRAEILRLRNAMELQNKLWNHARDKVDSLKAELESIKARRCAECKYFEENEHRWFSNVNDRCRNEEAYQRETEPDWYCPLWEPQPAPGGEEGKG